MKKTKKNIVFPMSGNRKEMKIERERILLLLVMNVLTDKWDEIEMKDPDQSTQKWMSYKRIRNNTRDVIREIAKSKGIKLWN